VPDERRSGPFTRVKWARLQTCEVYRGNRARARARARLGGEKARMKGRGLGVGHVRGCPVFALRVRSRGCRDELWSHTCEAEPAIASRNAAVRTHQSRGARRGAESRGGIILGVSRETRDTGGAVASSVSGISPIVSSIGRLGGSLEGFGRGASCRCAFLLESYPWPSIPVPVAYSGPCGTAPAGRARLGERPRSRTR
jgi:hypothetical protein